jgi:outer membrane autotransporter protein
VSLDRFLLGAYVFGGRSQMKSSRSIEDGQLAKGKFGSYIYGASASLGYPIKMDNHSLTPTVGLNFYGSTRKGYKESGVGARSIPKQNSSSLVAKVGARYAYTIEQDNMKIIPSLSVGCLKDLVVKSKSLRIDAESPGEFKSTNSKKKTSFYVKPGLALKTELFDFSLAYTFEKAKKYTGHVGSAKLLAKF